MRSFRNIVGAALGTSALLAAPVASVSPGSAQAGAAQPRAIECETSSSGQDADFYDGESASYVYDEKFTGGPDIPGLPEYTPQGLSEWQDWDGSGQDVLLTTSYLDGERSRIYAVDPDSGAELGAVAIAESHVGGIAVVNGWVFVQGTTDTVRKYDADGLAEALQAEGTPDVGQVGEPQDVYGSSFLAGAGDTLYAGKFSDTGRERMNAYAVAEDGTLSEGTSYEVPKKTQGLMVTEDNFVYSTSYGRGNRSNIYVVDRGAQDIDRPSTHCFRAPSMSEAITEHDGTGYLLFESGADQYSDARNVIERMHRSPVEELVREP